MSRKRYQAMRQRGQATPLVQEEGHGGRIGLCLKS